MSDIGHFTTHRRGFLGRVAASAAAFGLGALVAPLEAAAQPVAATGKTSANPEFEAWLNKITGKHKMLYDVPEPNEGFAFWWSRVFLNTTNETYGTTDADNTVVIVLRHSGIPFAMENAMWAKYKFGEAFKITDPATKGPAVRHPLLHLKPGDVPIPGIGTDELLAKGVLIGVCNIALTFNRGERLRVLFRRVTLDGRPGSEGLLPRTPGSTPLRYPSSPAPAAARGPARSDPRRRSDSAPSGPHPERRWTRPGGPP